MPNFAQSHQLNTLVIIDGNVPSYSSLIAEVDSYQKYVILDTKRDGIEQITQALENNPAVNTLHIVSHGRPGCIEIGNNTLDYTNIESYADQLVKWSAFLGHNGEILIYGCEVAQGEIGEKFLTHLQKLTGLNIAASNTLTGDTQQGGNWHLEFILGQIKSLLAFSPQVRANYGYVLAQFVNEPFTGLTVNNNWIYQENSKGNVILTGGRVARPPGFTSSLPVSYLENPGTGALRLTPTASQRGGFVLYNSPISSTQGVKVNFEYFAYNPGATEGADGMSFFLVTGGANPTAPGDVGDGLSYRNLVGGYLGIGFDEYGGFSTAGYGPTPASKDSVTVRGSTATGNPLLQTVNIANQGGVDAGNVSNREQALRKVQIVLTPSNAGQPNQLSVSMDFNKDGDFVDPGELIIAPFDVTQSNGPVPNTFKFGFAASTGDARNIHEIRNLIYETVNLPVSADKTVTTPEDISYNFGVGDFSFQDFDPADSLQYLRIEKLPTTGTLQLNGNNITAVNTEIPVADILAGRFKFIPIANDSGTPYANFQFRVSDGTSYSPGANQFTINVTPVNDPPMTNDDFTSTALNVPVALNIIANDSDIDGSITAFDLNPTQPGIQNSFNNNQGAFNLDNTGRLTFTPANNFFGTASIAYQAIDNNGAASTANVSINVINQAPIAIRDELTVNFNNPTITLNIGTNDRDIDGNITGFDLDPNIAGIQTQFTNSFAQYNVNNQGLLTLSNIQAPTWQANGIALIGSLFPYYAIDNLGIRSNPARVYVYAQNQNPVANDDITTTISNQSVNLNISQNDSDPDLAPVGGITAFDLNPQLAGIQSDVTTAQGEYHLNSQGVLNFQPSNNFKGTANLSYQIYDTAGTTDTANISIAVTNQAPVANNDTGSTITNIPLSLQIGANDRDPDGNITGFDLNPTQAGIQNNFSNNQGVFNVSNDGRLIFTPASNFVGTTGLDYQVTDNNGLTSNIANVSINVDNQAPIAIRDQLTVNFNNPTITLNIGSNDSDLDGSITGFDLDPNIAGVQTQFTNSFAQYSVNNQGLFTVSNIQAPTWQTNGIALIGSLFPYYAIDNLGAKSNPARVYIYAQNQIPVANDDITTITSNQSAILNISQNDSDPDLAPVGGITAFDLDPTQAGIQSNILKPEGQYNVNSQGVLNFQPINNFKGTANLPYAIYDTAGATDTANISIIVGNQAPIANNDQGSTVSNTALSLQIVANDRDPDGSITGFDLNPNQAGIQNSFSNNQGVFSIGNDGRLIFTPASNFVGIASLQYQAIDNNTATSNIANISINVTNQNPVANSDFTAVRSNTPFTLNIAANDSDPDGSITGFDLDPNTPGIQSTGTLANLGGYSINNNGQFSFTPQLNAQQVIGFIPYTVIDNQGATDQALVVVGIADSKPLASDDTGTMLSVSPALTLNIGANDADTDGSITAFDLNPVTATVELVTTNSAGTFSVNNNGQLVFTPVPTFTGSTTLPYQVWDNSGVSSNPAIITIFRTASPTAVNDSTTTISNQSVTLNIGTNDITVNGHNITAFDLDPTTTTIETDVTNNSGHFLVDSNGNLRFIPAQNYQGLATLPYKIIDSVGETATANINISVEDQNPVANNDTINNTSNQRLTYNIGNNDKDPDGSITGFDLNPGLTGIQNSLTTAAGTFSVDNSGQLIFTPASNFQGTANLPYQAIDNSGVTSNIATISINLQNQLPIANDDSTNTLSNQPVTLNLRTNDTDFDGSITAFDLDPNTPGVQPTLTTAQGTYSVSNQGEFVFIPTSNFRGTTNLPYQVTDNTGSTANANIQIVVGDRPPVATDDTTNTLSNTAVTLNIGANDSDPDGTIVGYDLDVTTTQIETSQQTSQGNWQVNNQGELIFTPAQNFQGVATLPYAVVDDNGATATANISITVGNQPPVANNDLRNTISNTKVTFNIGINDSDPDGSITAFDLNPQTTGVQTNITTPQGIYNVDRNGQLVFTPASNFQGTANLPYTVIDNSGATAIATITTIVSNQLPIANDDSTSTLSNQAVTFNIGVNDTDPDGNITGFDLDTKKGGIQNSIKTTQGRYSVDPNGELIFTPANNFKGIAILPYQAIDNSGASANAYISVAVENQPPVANNDTTNTVTNTAVTFNIGINDSDSDGGTIVAFDLDPKKKGIQTNRVTADGTYNIDNNGELVFTPSNNFKGTTNLNYQIFDNNSASDRANINIIVKNQPPVATDDSLSIQSNTVGIINLGVNDSDVDGSITAFDLNVRQRGIQVSRVTADGTYNVDSIGQLTFNPAQNFQGTANLSYQVFDNDGALDRANVNIIVGDQPPVAIDDIGYAGQNKTGTVNILANDYDPDGSITSIDLDTNRVGQQNQATTSQGQFTVDPRGNVTFTPISGFVGTANLPYQIFDNSGETASANIRMIVADQLPIATDDLTSTGQNQPVKINVLDNDIDLDGSITGTDLDTNTTGVQTQITTPAGKYVVDSRGNVTFTPVAGFTGTANIPYQIFDNNGETAVATLSIFVGDQPPIAIDDIANTRPSQPVSFNILTNDYDPDGSITGVDLNPSQTGIQRQRTTAQGSFSVDNSGNLTFTPIAGFLGQASIPYQIFDNSGVTAGANIIVMVEDQPPVATDDFAYTNQNQPVTLSNILSNDYDLDGSITGVDLDPKKKGMQRRVVKPEGTFIIDNDGNLAFTPVSGFLGVATLPYQIFDNDGLSAKANVLIGVGDQPPIAKDDLALTEKNIPATFNVLTNDYDFDGNITAVDLNPGQAGVQTARTTAQGIFTVSTNGNVVFTPVSGFVGTASIPYQIFDNNGETSTANMFVVVQEPVIINQPPVAIDDNSSTIQNQKVTLNILTNDTDVDGSITGIDLDTTTLGVQVSITTTQGVFNVDENGNLSFTPSQGLVGVATLPYTIFDNNGASATANINIRVSETVKNILPVAVDDGTSTTANQPISVNILSNDFDVDGSITALDLNPNTAGIQRNVRTPEGTFSVDTNGNLTFTPVSGFTGTATLEYQITDNSGATDIGNVNITVIDNNSSDQPPVAHDDATHTNINQPVILNILDNDFDADGSITGIDLDPNRTGIQRVVTNSQGIFSVTNNGELTFTPAQDFTGTASIPYQIFDDQGVASTANINILVLEPVVINQPPVAIDDIEFTLVNEPVSLNILTNDSDPDGSIVEIDLDTKTPGLQANITTNQGIFNVDGNGNLVFTPAREFSGVATLPYTIFDNNGATATANINITVDEIVRNIPPVAVDDGTSTTINTPVNLNILDNDFDIDGSITGLDLDPNTTGIQRLVTTDAGTFSLDNNGNVTFTPVSDFVGEATLKYQITDNTGLTDIGNINISVFDDTVTTNQPPIAVDDFSYTTINQPVELNILDNDFDVDGSITGLDLDPNTTGIQRLVTTDAGTFSLDNNGNVTFTPVSDFVGEATLEYQITDNTGLTDIGNINISVFDDTVTTNQPPIAVDDFSYTTINQPVELNILDNDFDVDGSITGLDLDPNTTGIQRLVTTDAGTFSLDNNGNVTFTPVSDFVGEATLKYQITDNTGLTDIGNINITVFDDTVTTNQPPTAVDDFSYTTINQPVELNILDNDFDVDGSITGLDLDPNTTGIQRLVTTDAGTFSLDNNGNVTFTPVSDFVGEATLEYQITDNTDLTDIGNINITVFDDTVTTNQPPIAVEDFSYTTINQPVELNILDNDFDVDGSITGIDLDPNTTGIQRLVTTDAGTFSLDNNGNVTFTPVSDFVGEATLEYQITDNTGLTDIGNINIAVFDDTVTTNQPPVANNDATYTFLNQRVTLDITRNDFDVDGIITAIDLDPNKPGIQRVFTNSQGRFTVNQNGELVFTPVRGFIGDANINYQIFDNLGATDTANINILVVEEQIPPPPNQPPVAIDDSTTTQQNQPINLNILSNDSDADGSITGIDLDTTTNGIQTAITTSDGVFKVSADGNLTFTPTNGFTGVATLPYQIFDNSGLSDTANISIRVEAETIVTPPTDNTDNTVTNKPPVANYDSTSTTQNKAVTLNISSNDSDSDGNITAVDLNPDVDGIQRQITTAQGSFSLDNNGILTFVPVSDFTGVATLTYQVTDNDGLQDTAIINIRVNEATKPLEPIECDCEEPVLLDNTAQPVDVLNTVNGTDIISGGDNDTIVGTEASENIISDGGDDFIDGQSGNDNIIAGRGNDFILGEDGNDYILGERNDDIVLAGKDNDLVRGGKDDDLIGGEFGNDTLFGDKGNDNMIGGRIDEEDTIGQDWLYGGLGSDQLYGQGGDDYLSGEQDNDSLLGGEGNDLLNGGENNDLLYGEQGNDKIIGGNGEDTIYAGKENDIALGNQGNDELFGGDGNDTLGGNEGNDTLHGGNAYESSAVGSNGQQDYLSGGEGNDWILGEEGEDKLCGDAGNDTLEGGKDNDTLCGGDGDDWLRGELGDDTIISGAGNDLILLGGNDGKDVIADLQIGNDHLVLPQGVAFNQLKFTQSSGGTLINYDGQEIALLSNIAPTDITADLFKSPLI